MSSVSQVPYYNALVEQHGNSSAVAGWGSRESQRRRFEVFCQHMPVANARLLDVGCGRGDLLEFLKTTGRTPSAYVGVELMPELASYARINHPDAKILDGDLADVSALQVDYAVSSGMFNRRIPDHEEWMKITIARMFTFAKKAAGFNVLSAQAPELREGQYHADPSHWMAWCQTLTPLLVVRHDYAAHDCTFILLHEAVDIDVAKSRDSL